MRLPKPALSGTLILIAALGVGLTACGGHPASPAASRFGAASDARPSAVQGTVHSPASAGTAKSASGTAGVGQAVKPAQEDIVVTGDVALRVGRHDVRAAFGQVGALARRLDGYLASSNLHAVGKTPSATLTIRVPQASVNQLLASISKLGRVTSQHLTGTDVTGTVIDTQAQITNLKSEEVALRALMSRTGSVTQILQVQEQLFSVEGQVQELTAQQSSLLTRVTYATVSVDITQPAQPVASRSLLGRGWSLAASNTVSALRGVVLAIAWAAPIWVLGAIAAGLFVLWRRRRHGHPTGPGSGRLAEEPEA